MDAARPPKDGAHADAAGRCSADDAERLLGRVPPGIRGNYDWYSYTAEKANALQKLAVLINDIVQPGSELAARRA
jgi:hypothetical protein